MKRILKISFVCILVALLSLIGILVKHNFFYTVPLKNGYYLRENFGKVYLYRNSQKVFSEQVDQFSINGDNIVGLFASGTNTIFLLDTTSGKHNVYSKLDQSVEMKQFDIPNITFWDIKTGRTKLKDGKILKPFEM